MAAHRSVARDPELRQWLVAEIRRRRASAAGAIVAAEDHFSAVLSTTGSDILRDRALDIRDVCVRLARQLYGEHVGGGETRLDAESICVADTLTPGEFLSLDRNLLKGVVLARGSATSHTAILARSFAVPMLGGVTGLDTLEQDGADAIVDADLGALVTGPDQSVLRYYDMERARLAGRRARQDAVASQAATTSDGRRIEVAANIASAAEADAAFSAGAEGIGLLRTELLFAGRRQAPDEAEQFDEYRRVLERAGHRRVLIRTLDVGGDKPLPYLRLPAEDNPFLGCRGVRLYAGHDALIRGQVRALVRASAGGNLGLMLPMISRLDEVRLARAVIAEEQARCTAEGVPFDTRMQVGAMIEVPSAAFALPELAAELDFFSVGTNDLLQYFVAADRSNRQVADLYNAFAPPFLRLLEKIVCGVHQAGRSVGICGEMAADVNALPLLVGLGFDDISMAPPGIGASKAAVRRLSAAACRDLLARAVSCATAGEVEALVRNADCWRPAPLIEPGLVILDADCRSKDEAIKALVDQLYIDGRTDEPRRIEEAVWDREAVYSTGFGHGFAIPHCKTDQLRSTSLVMLRMQQPVDWNALDGQPVGFALLLAIRGTDHEKEHMKVLATLARQLMHGGVPRAPRTGAGFQRPLPFPARSHRRFRIDEGEAHMRRLKKHVPALLLAWIVVLLVATGRAQGPTGSVQSQPARAQSGAKASPAAQGPRVPPDLTKQPTLYVVGYAHLDTQWRWDYVTTIREYIPKTIRDNFTLFEKYPNYVFNFSGANRYRMMKEYYPADYEKVKKYVAAGRWFPSGSSMEENDVNSPSAESIIRQILYGTQFFKREFGKTSAEFMLPDCFGFPASLPSLLAHTGIKGFSTQKLSSSWQPAARVGGPNSPENTPDGIPFNVGIWEGTDGKTVIAALNPGSYGGSVTYDLTKTPPPPPAPLPQSSQPAPRPLIDWGERIRLNGQVTGIFADYMYYGTGDTGGTPSESSVKLMDAIVTRSKTVLPPAFPQRGGQSAQPPAPSLQPPAEVQVGDGPVKVVSATSEELFLNLKPEQTAKLPRYKGDLELINHSAGSITSQAYLKRWNRHNELMADAAEKASVAAAWLGGRPYPQERLNNAWTLVMGGQFHDIIPGTSLPKAYRVLLERRTARAEPVCRRADQRDRRRRLGAQHADQGHPARGLQSAEHRARGSRGGARRTPGRRAEGRAGNGTGRQGGAGPGPGGQPDRVPREGALGRLFGLRRPGGRCAGGLPAQRDGILARECAVPRRAECVRRRWQHLRQGPSTRNCSPDRCGWRSRRTIPPPGRRGTWTIRTRCGRRARTCRVRRRFASSKRARPASRSR